jgi:type IV secretion system protein VirB11
MSDHGLLCAREEQSRRLAETLRRQLGPRFCDLLCEPDVIELMLNPDGRVWVDRLCVGMSRSRLHYPPQGVPRVHTRRV